MVIAYGCSNLLQSIAARRIKPQHSMHPSFLLRLAGQRTYMAGIAFQIMGFGLAFMARRTLPLFVVQASVAAGLGVMAVLGVALLKWRLPRGEVMMLGLLGIGVAALVVSARPGESRPIDLTGELVLGGVLAGIAVAGVFSARLKGVPGSVVLGSLAGLAFGAAAVDSRALAGVANWHMVPFSPLLYLLFAHSLMGSLLLGMAMQRGSTTAAVAAMDAASVAPASIIGLALLGDQIWPGRHLIAAAGFTCTLVAVIGLARFAQPQVHPSVTTPVVATASVPVPVTMTLPVVVPLTIPSPALVAGTPASGMPILWRGPLASSGAAPIPGSRLGGNRAAAR
jgi:hypothetical protein